ncbi:hypothetical protein LMG27952_00974 [Paraburkholderia hiiakae]|uniref:Uncharacterized protein n=1 Tax=Paraburkholderia hiiakae TaxID=1081782 RepID=A0ABN7HH32_9BURK|nr:hypothetical protein LMG27952_00974 [Paraburkholderia hiiakae]
MQRIGGGAQTRLMPSLRLRHRAVCVRMTPRAQHDLLSEDVCRVDTQSLLRCRGGLRRSQSETCPLGAICGLCAGHAHPRRAAPRCDAMRCDALHVRLADQRSLMSIVLAVPVRSGVVSVCAVYHLSVCRVDTPTAYLNALWRRLRSARAPMESDDASATGLEIKQLQKARRSPRSARFEKSKCCCQLARPHCVAL